VPDQVEKLRQKFGLSRVALVGDRGMLTPVQIDKLQQHPGLSWITALKSVAIHAWVEPGACCLLNPDFWLPISSLRMTCRYLFSASCQIPQAAIPRRQSTDRYGFDFHQHLWVNKP
jgi:hypothetical protein